MLCTDSSAMLSELSHARLCGTHNALYAISCCSIDAMTAYCAASDALLAVVECHRPGFVVSLHS
eukprot:19963-Heterococcus_DN1.PRE.2